MSWLAAFLVESSKRSMSTRFGFIQKSSQIFRNSQSRHFAVVAESRFLWWVRCGFPVICGRDFSCFSHSLSHNSDPILSLEECHACFIFSWWLKYCSLASSAPLTVLRCPPRWGRFHLWLRSSMRRRLGVIYAATSTAEVWRQLGRWHWWQLMKTVCRRAW